MDYKELAEQLRCSDGERGGEAADSMFRTNSNMIKKTIDALKIQSSATILEIGFGNAMHIPYLLERATGIKYFGIDISELMVECAIKNNLETTDKCITHFIKVSGNSILDFGDDFFHRAFTVNTIYFWEDALLQIKEIHRVLKTNGQITLAFIEKDFAETLPFTQYGFTLYRADTVAKILEDAGFTAIEKVCYSEEIISNTGKEMLRPFIIITAVKK